MFSGDFLNIFPDGVWNVHPSELPKYRGATPLQAQIIDGLKEIKVTVIKMDEGMDSGDILAQEKMNFDWEEKSISELEYEAGFLGGKIFFNKINGYFSLSHAAGQTEILIKQNHSQATFTKILNKEDGDVTKQIQEKNLELIWRKYNAYKNWPGIYFVHPTQNIRVKITEMTKNQILKLLPESKKEISITDFEKVYGKLDV